ncbi:MAG: M14 family zinc carboxypeptidase [candidate division WOR-3 bacterium]
MKKACALFGLLLFIGIVLGEPVKMEARVYFKNVDNLIVQLGDLFGELDIATVGETPQGEYYLVIITDQEQLDKIQAIKGIRTEVTYADIREKFYKVTGVRDPEMLRDFGYFYTYWEVRDSLNRWVTLQPSICRLYSAGRSHQGLDLIALKISDNPTVDEMEPAVLFNGATHAREPMGTHLCMDYIKYLIDNYNRDSIVTWFIRNREIYFIPVMNPDGYRYNSDSGGATANWRKNRRVIQSPYVGVDLNRNYGYRWGYNNSGSSPNPSSETYRGPSRFSEPETQAARDFFLPKKIRTQMDYHSYGPYNLCVWGYSSTAEPIPDSAMQWQILDSIRAKNGYTRTGPIIRVLYETNGTSIEWEMKDTLHNGVPKFVTYAYSIETNQTDFWDGYNNMSVINRNITENRPVNYYLTKIAGVFFDQIRPVVADTALGNRTGQLDPRETSHLWFFIRNRAIHPLDSAYNISAHLVSLDTQITVQTANATFPTIRRNSVGDNRNSRFQVYCSRNATPGSRKALRLELTFKDDTCTIRQALTCTLTIGNAVVISEQGEPINIRNEFYLLTNPARHQVLFQVNGMPESKAEIRIYNVSGQLIKNLPLTINYTPSTILWDRTDNRMRKVESGVYFYHYQTGDFIAQGKIILLE